MRADLRINNIHAGYHRAKVLHGFSAVCRCGHITALIGANGAGKTTLLRTLTGYLSYRSGSLCLGDLDIAALAPRVRAQHIALVPQVSTVLLTLSVWEAVMLARYPQRNRRFANGDSDKVAVDAAIDALQLRALIDTRCDELSGGEWRRVLIAQGLAQEPDVLLLDEPTAFLDPPARRRTFALLRDLAATRNIIVLAVLHDLDLAREFAAHVVLMRYGKALAGGEPKAVLTSELLCQLYDCDPRWLGAMEEAKCD